MNPGDNSSFAPRRKTRAVRVGRLTIGGDAAIVVQSMTKTDTRDVARTVEQIQQTRGGRMRNRAAGRAGYRGG